jgi:predicted dehydrogenase
MTRSISRRDLFAAAGAALATTALSRARVFAANETFGVGLIGAGGQGSFHLSKLIANKAVRVLGVCDIYRPRLERAAQVSGAQPYHDYRDLLDRSDVDCIWVATPDHWHARMAMDAMDAGKDVYCEKPMARYWHEARDFYRATLRTRRVVQVGSQDTSRPVWWKAREVIREGKLGRLVWSQTSIARNIRDGDWQYGIDLDAGPHDLDWKAFLGPAENRPYDPERFFRWRKYWDYSGGIATDLFVHVLHSLCIPLGNDWPVRVASAGGVRIHTDRETPETFHSLIDYAGGHTVFVAGTQANEQGLPVVIRGHEATMYLGGGDLEVRPERIYGGKRRIETWEVSDVGDAIDAHHANFFDCIRRRDPHTNCDALLGYKVDIAADLAVESWRRDRIYRFDPKTEEVRS